jgi:hypothetical protein
LKLPTEKIIQDLDSKKPCILFADQLLSFIKKVESEGGWMREKWSHQDEWTKEEIKQ